MSDDLTTHPLYDSSSTCCENTRLIRDSEWIGALIEVLHPVKIVLPKHDMTPKEIVEMIVRGAAQ